MRKQDLKTLIILILLIANILLEAQIIPKKIAEKRDRESMNESIVNICEKNGVTLQTQTLPRYTTLYRLDVGRNADTEAKAMEALLGQVSRQDMGGGILSYDGRDGRAVFRTGGDFQIELEKSGGITDSAGDVLDRMGFPYGELSVTQTGDDAVYSAVQLIQGVPVSDCTVSLTYTDGVLTDISGRWITQYTASQQEGSDLATCVVDLLRHRSEEGMIFGSIESIAQCFVLSHTGSGIYLNPAWCMATDAGEYTLDALSGEIAR